MSTRLVQTRTATLVGIDAVPVTVELLARHGEAKPVCTIIGLGDAAVKEARERVQGAVGALGVTPPNRILINLYPAELRKEGTMFDLAIAAALLIAEGRIKAPALAGISMFGELSLRGEVLPVRGMLALAACAAANGARAIIVPAENAAEAALCCACPVFAIAHLRQILDPALLVGISAPDTYQAGVGQRSRTDPFLDVVGQERAKRALTIAAAGGHNVLMIGPPGCGKSMLASRMAQLLPRMSSDEVVETVRVHSLANQRLEKLLTGERPFRAPHYASTGPGLIGGGQPFTPGEVSLAHRGVLFLDEFPEFKRTVLEALRIPLEQGTLSVSRARGSYVLPAHFQLIAAMNPCPCGKLGSAHRCECTLGARAGYLARLSQPILDRIDMHVELQSVSVGQVARSQGAACVPASVMNDRIEQVDSARAHAVRERGKANSALSSADLQRVAPIAESSARLFEAAAEKFGLSARAVTRVMRVARTIADLEHASAVSTGHIAEALSYRTLERHRVHV